MPIPLNGLRSARERRIRLTVNRSDGHMQAQGPEVYDARF